MLGAIAGDIVGSVFEGSGRKETDFPLFSSRSTFTDDTVLTIAVAAVLLDGGDYASSLRHYGRKYPDRGYGGSFYEWLHDDSLGPYNSWGNGSAMRVSPVGFAAKTIDDVVNEAERSAVVTHNHPEGVRGAQATALSVFLARNGASKSDIRHALTGRFGYNLTRTVGEIRPGYMFDVSCQGSVPEAIICFLDSSDFEGAIRLAISMGGDADTMACIAGGIAEAFYGGVPDVIATEVRNRLSEDLLDIVDRFRARFL